MLAAVAEMERDLLVERTQAGLARAKSAGKVLGRPVKASDEQKAAINERRLAGTSISALSRETGLSRATVMRIVA
jgi:DNA invertase Pin-like site-specific DNA recombinase